MSISSMRRLRKSRALKVSKVLTRAALPCQRTGRNCADYGASVEVSEGSAVRTSEAAGSSGLSGGSSKGRCS